VVGHSASEKFPPSHERKIKVATTHLYSNECSRRRRISNSFPPEKIAEAGNAGGAERHFCLGVEIYGSWRLTKKISIETVAEINPRTEPAQVLRAKLARKIQHRYGLAGIIEREGNLRSSHCTCDRTARARSQVSNRRPICRIVSHGRDVTPGQHVSCV